jgi:hypothetical protein
MTPPCSLSFAELIDYRFGDEPASETEHIEEHLFECSTCRKRASLLAALESGIVDLVHGGALSGGATVRLVERAEAIGVKLRSYRIEPGGSVDCTAAPGDDFVVVRLSIDAPEAISVDVDAEVTFQATRERTSRTFENVGIDREAGELVYLFPGSYVRSLPRSTWIMRARLVEPGGPREMGPYRMEHTPWEELDA